MFTIVSERAKAAQSTIQTFREQGLEYQDPDDHLDQLLHGRSRPRPSLL